MAVFTASINNSGMGTGHSEDPDNGGYVDHDAGWNPTTGVARRTGWYFVSYPTIPFGTTIFTAILGSRWLRDPGAAANYTLMYWAGFPGWSWNALNVGGLSITTVLGNTGQSLQPSVTGGLQQAVNTGATSFTLALSPSFANSYMGTTASLGSISVKYGYNVPAGSASSPGARTVNVSWTKAPTETNLDGYRVRLYRVSDNSLAYAQTATPGSTSLTFSAVKADSYYAHISSAYTDSVLGGVYTNPYQTGVVTVVNAAPTQAWQIQPDVPFRRSVTIVYPTSQYANNDYWQAQILCANGATLTVTTPVGSVPSDYRDLTDKDGTTAHGVSVQLRATWSDGDVSAWTSPQNFVMQAPPQIVGLTATTTEYRQITGQWNWINDCYRYKVVMDEGLPGERTQFVTNPSGGPSVTSTITDVFTGSHTYKVTPEYNNGYQTSINPVVFPASATGISVRPTPNQPTVLADNPNPREIRVTLPTSFYNMSTWEIMRDGVFTAGGFTGASGILGRVPAGSHTVMIRARYLDNDFSNWSPASTTVTTTSPAPINLAARQRSANHVPATVSTATTGGTIPAGIYFVAYSINKAGARATETVNLSSRAVNESTPSAAASITTTGSTSTVTITRGSISAGDTWNVYIGTDKNKLKRVGTDLSSTATQYIITAYSAPTTNEGKHGRIDIGWTNPATADAPVSFRVERAPNVPPNDPNGVTGTTWTDVSNTIRSGFYNFNSRFYEDGLDTKFYHYRLMSRYTNDDGSTDTSPSLEVVV